MPTLGAIWGAQGRRVQLNDGLTCTKTTTDLYAGVYPDYHPFHALWVHEVGGNSMAASRIVRQD
jgi:hypothetical protein